MPPKSMPQVPVPGIPMSWTPVPPPPNYNDLVARCTPQGVGELGFQPPPQYHPGQLLQPLQPYQPYHHGGVPIDPSLSSEPQPQQHQQHQQHQQQQQQQHQQHQQQQHQHQVQHQVQHQPQPQPQHQHQPQHQPQPQPPAPAPAPSSNTSRKRKSDAIEEPEEILQQPEVIPDISDDDPRLYHVDQSCQQIRRKIRDFIDGANMKVKEFQEAIGVSARSYQNFMSMTGTDKGMNCDTYPAAFKFFKKRELQGLRALPPKKSKTGPRKNIAEEKASKTFDTGGLQLDGEDRQAVPVYDTCDEVRKKIRAFLKKPDVTQAAFCRAIGASFPEKRSIQSRQLSTFLGRKGPTAGNTSAVFYGSYVFFEKMRIKEGKPKSQFRLEMESIHPKGMNVTDQIDGGWVTMHKDERMVQDKYGRIDFVRVR